MARCPPFAQICGGFHVRVDKIGHMDIVADARAVRRVVIAAEHLQRPALARDGLENVRDQMRFGLVILAVRLRSAARVEIPQRHIPQTIGFSIPVEHFLDHELRQAVRRDGIRGKVFCKGHALRKTVRSARRAEDKLFHAAIDGSVQQGMASADVVLEIYGRVLDRFAHQSECREMHDRLDAVLFEELVEQRPVARVSLDEFRAPCDRLPVASRQVVQHHHALAGLEQQLRSHAANIPGPAGYQYRHSHISTR